METPYESSQQQEFYDATHPFRLFTQFSQDLLAIVIFCVFLSIDFSYHLANRQITQQNK